MATKMKAPAVRTKRWAQMRAKNPMQFHADPSLLDQLTDWEMGGVLVPTPIPPQSEHLLSENPCVRAYGPSKASASCFKCIKLQMNVGQESMLKPNGQAYTVALHVCTEREGTHAPHINHEASWPACARFEAIEVGEDAGVRQDILRPTSKR